MANTAEPVTDMKLWQQAHEKSRHLGRQATHRWAQELWDTHHLGCNKRNHIKMSNLSDLAKARNSTTVQRADTAAKTPCPNLANRLCGAITLLPRLSIYLCGSGHLLWVFNSWPICPCHAKENYQNLRDYSIMMCLLRSRTIMAPTWEVT